MINKIKFDLLSDRIGPDCPFTHWRLYFRQTNYLICKKKFARFEKSSVFRPGAYAITCSKISIGKNVVIRPTTMLFADPREGKQGQIIISDNVMIGSGVHIYVSNHQFSRTCEPIIKQGSSEPESVVLEEGCWVGANAIILPGVVIGKNSVIGAGSVVSKSIPDYCVAVGSPARVIKKIKKT